MSSVTQRYYILKYAIYAKDNILGLFFFKYFKYLQISAHTLML